VGGKLIGYLGPMFSGKTEELVRLVNREQYANRTFAVYKPITDDRYHKLNIVTNNGIQISAKAIPEDGFQIICDFFEVPFQDVFIDEIQFFESTIIESIRLLNSLGSNVFYAGLSTTSENKPFPFKDADPITGYPHMGDLIAGLHHSQITIQNAFCSTCQDEAHFTNSLIAKQEAVKVGGKQEYEALCAKCYYRLHPYEIPKEMPEEIKKKIQELQRFYGWRN
jgi:thymidine kinase